mmetsp:Transcript_23062/g.30681  ORF Transcript_23062/g.30681 Transcript_23062/m.30681 type:complete len:164 (-) Transcript_23062:66-557(-)
MIEPSLRIEPIPLKECKSPPFTYRDTHCYEFIEKMQRDCHEAVFETLKDLQDRYVNEMNAIARTAITVHTYIKGVSYDVPCLDPEAPKRIRPIYYINWRHDATNTNKSKFVLSHTNRKFVSIRCIVKGCNFGITFFFEPSAQGKPINLRHKHNIRLSHSFPIH